jgi:hypothetical protein
MDIERIRYSLSRYLRTRLLKIEKSIHFILSDLEYLERLSKPEQLFATTLSNTLNAFYDTTIYSRFDGAVKDAVSQNEDFYKHSQPNFEVIQNLTFTYIYPR